MREGECLVSVLEHPVGVFLGCKVCRKILKTGRFLIGIHVRENGADFAYLLGTSELEHCGEQKEFFVCFDSREQAEAEANKVTAEIGAKGTTEGLLLMEISWLKKRFDPRMN